MLFLRGFWDVFLILRFPHSFFWIFHHCLLIPYSGDQNNSQSIKFSSHSSPLTKTPSFIHVTNLHGLCIDDARGDGYSGVFRHVNMIVIVERMKRESDAMTSSLLIPNKFLIPNLEAHYYHWNVLLISFLNTEFPIQSLKILRILFFFFFLISPYYIFDDLATWYTNQGQSKMCAPFCVCYILWL